MSLFEYSGRVPMQSDSGGVLEHFEDVLRKRGASALSRRNREVSFRVPWHGHHGPLFHADSGRLSVSQDGRELHYSLSYRRSAVHVAALVVLFTVVVSEILGEEVPIAGRVAIISIGWAWLWGVWRLIMPRSFQKFVRWELDRCKKRRA